MFNKPFIINNNGKILVFPQNTCIDELHLYELESTLRQFTTSINYSENIHEFEFDIYSIWSLLVMGEDKLDDFISFLRKNSVNELPELLVKDIENQKKNFKQVLLTEELDDIIIRVLRGDLESIIEKTFKREVIYDKKRNVYITKKINSFKVTDKFQRNNISVKLDNYLESVDTIPLDLKCTFELRYYQKEAFNIITRAKQENGVIFMPPGSGKSYIALKLIEYLKVPTLILCNNSEEYWMDFINSNISTSSGNFISLFDEKDNNKMSPITLCSYQKAKDNVLNRLKEIQWGLILFDDAHRSLAEKSCETLFIKSKYKFALAATLNRSDGRGYQLYDIIGPKIYYITWQELKKRLYVNDILKVYQLN